MTCSIAHAQNQMSAFGHEFAILDKRVDGRAQMRRYAPGSWSFWQCAQMELLTLLGENRLAHATRHHLQCIAQDREMRRMMIEDAQTKTLGLGRSLGCLIRARVELEVQDRLELLKYHKVNTEWVRTPCHLHLCSGHSQPTHR